MKTYEQERRPVAALMQNWSKIHMMKLMGLSTAVKLDPVVIESMDERDIALREEIDQISTFSKTMTITRASALKWVTATSRVWQY